MTDWEMDEEESNEDADRNNDLKESEIEPPDQEWLNAPEYRLDYYEHLLEVKEVFDQARSEMIALGILLVLLSLGTAAVILTPGMGGARVIFGFISLMGFATAGLFLTSAYGCGQYRRWGLQIATYAIIPLVFSLNIIIIIVAITLYNKRKKALELLDDLADEGLEPDSPEFISIIKDLVSPNSFGIRRPAKINIQAGSREETLERWLLKQIPFLKNHPKLIPSIQTKRFREATRDLFTLKTFRQLQISLAFFPWLAVIIASGVSEIMPGMIAGAGIMLLQFIITLAVQEKYRTLLSVSLYLNIINALSCIYVIVVPLLTGKPLVALFSLMGIGLLIPTYRYYTLLTPATREVNKRKIPLEKRVIRKLLLVYSSILSYRKSVRKYETDGWEQRDAWTEEDDRRAEPART